LTLLQVLIPVTEVQVKASTVKDMSGHYLWELIHLKSQVQRRTEKVYHLSNRSGSSPFKPFLEKKFIIKNHLLQ
jgi:hypothetical protein